MKNEVIAILEKVLGYNHYQAYFATTQHEYLLLDISTDPRTIAEKVDKAMMQDAIAFMH